MKTKTPLEMDYKIIEVDGRSLLVFREFEGEDEQQRHVIHLHTWVEPSVLYKVSAILAEDATAEIAKQHVADTDEAAAREFIAAADQAMAKQIMDQEELVAMMERAFYGTASQTNLPG
ncbi:hypothetical protein FAES_3656 [Fibrella aestuarina BUZ 2]|uniref:Uncharacterized protein n=1 Tax=Fibrella aestuarina BUZ 2 TaxID=1166018 RepID=I0KC10_9BACT|nr:hypothetical protein [Fibrella aestuarina]CCH01663.1 hypothetical protein FAES_3656 [Fibrella aestuarina BUZ 2]